MSQRSRGKRAIITGGGSGIGRATAIKLAQEGASVAVLDVSLETAQRTVDFVVESGGTGLALLANVADELQMETAINTAEEHFGGIDSIVANAGIMMLGRDTVVTDLDLETWRQCIDVNLTGMFLTCKYGLRALQRQRRGAIVITGSPTGTHGCAPTFTAYSTSKAGALGLMRVLAVDYVKDNIRVNAVMPGTTNSPLVTMLMEKPATRAEFLARIPMARSAEPEEIANVIAFLVSEEASYVTGAVWYADGGLTAI